VALNWLVPYPISPHRWATHLLQRGELAQCGRLPERKPTPHPATIAASQRTHALKGELLAREQASLNRLCTLWTGIGTRPYAPLVTPNPNPNPPQTRLETVVHLEQRGAIRTTRHAAAAGSSPRAARARVPRPPRTTRAARPSPRSTATSGISAKGQQLWLPAWGGSDTALAGGEFGLQAGENLAIQALYRPLSLSETGTGRAPGRYHKQLPNSPDEWVNATHSEPQSNAFVRHWLRMAHVSRGGPVPQTASQQP
jgi:hypothetical protein